MRFSINCSTVICSPTVDAILREATNETYGPRVYSIIKFPIYFTLQSLLSIYIIKIPKYLSLSVYKSRGAPFDPFTCARTVGVAPTATLRGGKPERSQRNKMVRGNAKARNTRQQRGEVETPGKALAGPASAALARTLPEKLALIRLQRIYNF